MVTDYSRLNCTHACLHLSVPWQLPPSQPSVFHSPLWLSEVHAVQLTLWRCLPAATFILSSPSSCLPHSVLRDGLCQAAVWSGDMSVPPRLPSLHCSQEIFMAPSGMLGPVADLSVGYLHGPCNYLTLSQKLHVTISHEISLLLTKNKVVIKLQFCQTRPFLLLLLSNIF